VVVPNEHEVALLGGADHLLELGTKAVVVTRGSQGADLHTAAGVAHSPAFAVSPVDTTGAGDAFCGVLAARLAAGDPLEGALRYALAGGALATTVAGAVPSMPTLASIEVLLTNAT
jgi:ribokinase